MEKRKKARKESKGYKEPNGVKIEGIKKPTIVVGLPGIGNVGKIVTDYVIEQLKAKEIGKFYIDTPPMVFPTYESVEFPSVKVYSAEQKGLNFIFIAGDYQPREAKCFEFCSSLLEIFKKTSGKEIIILGGASLPKINVSPSIYAIASNAGIIQKYKKLEPEIKLAHGNLGPIVGVAGVLLGMAKDAGVNAVAFLTETTEREYFNANSVKKALLLLNKLTGIDVDTKKFDARMKKINAEITALRTFITAEPEERGLEGVDFPFGEHEGKREGDEKVGYIG